MKKITLFMTAMVIAMGCFAQSNKEEVDLIQAAFGMEKKMIVANFVQPSESQQEAFWSLYDEYENERKELGKKRIQLLEQYVSLYSNLSDEQADEWTREVMKLSGTTDKLIETYYNKIKKVTSPVVATQFYQIENFILIAIRMSILEEIPFLEK